MTYDAAKSWGKLYTPNSDIAYPAEGVIRIFKGSFPDLKMPPAKPGDKILDVGCGDGRHLALFQALGLDSSGVEITDEISATLKANMDRLGIGADIRTGHAGQLPYESNTFDYLLTWNSCYYMSYSGMKFEEHVAEMARVIKPGGWIVCSVPKKTSFIFDKSTAMDDPAYRVIGDDYFGSRNGEIMRCMSDRNDMVRSFDPHFKNFCHADLDMEWFGLPYHWHVFCAEKKA